MGKMILVPEETWMEIQRILHSVTEKMGEAVKEGKEDHESIKGSVYGENKATLVL